MALIELPVIFKYGGKQLEAMAVLDTGADSFAFVDESVAVSLGIPKGTDLTAYSGVGGKQEFGFKAPFSLIQLKEAPSCALQNAQVLVGRLGFNKIKALIGNNFIRQAKMTIDYSQSKDGEVELTCKGGPTTPIKLSEPISPWMYAVGAGALLLILGLALSD